MNLFVIFFIFSAWFCFLAWKPELGSRKISLAVMAFLTAGLIFDFKVGVDTGSYIWLYRSIMQNAIDYRNMGYVYLIRGVQLFSDRYTVSVLTVNIICIGLCIYTIFRYSRDWLMSYFLFFSSGLFLMYYSSGIRQMLSMAVFLFAFYEYLPQNKYLQYFVCCLLSMSFHEAGIISFAVPLVFLFQRYYRQNPVRAAGCAVFGILGVFGIISFLIPWIVKYYWWVPAIRHFVMYVDNASFSILGLGMELVWFAVVLLLYYLSGGKNHSEWEQFQMLVWGFSLAVYLCMVRYPQTSRICDYLQTIMLIFVPNLLNEIPDMKRKLAGLIPLIGLSFILMYGDLSFVVSRVRSTYSEIEISMTHYPYVSVFDEMTIEQYYGSYFVE